MTPGLLEDSVSGCKTLSRRDRYLTGRQKLSYMRIAQVLLSPNGRMYDGIFTPCAR